MTFQAASQMDANWTLMKEGLPETPKRPDWLVKNLNSGSVVAVDPYLITSGEFLSLDAKLKEKEIELRPLTENLVDKVWGGEQPGYPENPVLPLDLKFAGKGTFFLIVSKCIKPTCSYFVCVCVFFESRSRYMGQPIGWFHHVPP